ncbi:M28 family peptidase [Streptomyces sp. NPDC049627]|uniref:M28 family peptidase n=1 Tax=Streptomyces sp. NPDC049627 TaxID=3365595 RepID=UPI0037AFAAAB
MRRPRTTRGSSRRWPTRSGELGRHVQRHPFRWRGRQLFNLEAEHRVAGADSTVRITATWTRPRQAVTSWTRTANLAPTTGGGPALGADDDGSGTAGVMAAAQCLAALRAGGRQPTRNVRFVLFNVEEQGLVGSKSYARAAAVGATVSPGACRGTGSRDWSGQHAQGREPRGVLRTGPGPGGFRRARRPRRTHRTRFRSGGDRPAPHGPLRPSGATQRPRELP